MLNPIKILFNQVRHYKHHSNPRSWKRDAVKYGLVSYYPRYKNHVDPPITPSKLFLVERIKPVKGNPYWEKDVLKNVGLYSKKKIRQQTVVKNIPEMCAMLWKIKHLIKVTPIELPEKLPEDIDSVSTYLHDCGKLLVFPKISEEKYKATEEFRKNQKRLDGDTLQEKLRLQWLNAME